MSDYKFRQVPGFDRWIISAPKRSHRPKISGTKKSGKVCIFCAIAKSPDEEVYRIGGEKGDSNWLVRVIKNKFPFAPIHEIVVHTPDHLENFTDLSVDQVRLVIETYATRFKLLESEGTVCIFGNSGRPAGESIPHSHSQIAVVPREVKIYEPRLEEKMNFSEEHLKIGEYTIVCPPYSQWPDEVWVVPQERGKKFVQIEYKEIESLAFIVKRLVRIMELRHGQDFPHNYAIYPFKDWYFRLVPRAKIIGGFEVSTGIFVNTQDPRETIKFIRDHFYEENEKKVKRSKAKYRRHV